MVFKKGYKQTPEQLAKLSSVRKGKVPWNKGIHMWTGKEHPRGSLGKSPHNKGKFKDRRLIEGYFYCRIGDNLIPEHHIVWCKANGVNHIPYGCVIHHIDQNRLNNKIDNLQLMDKKFHMQLHRKFENKKYWGKNNGKNLTGSRSQQ